MASHLSALGHDVEILSVPGEDWENQRITSHAGDPGEEIESYNRLKREAMKIAISGHAALERMRPVTGDRYVYVGLPFERILERVREINPDLIGISLIASCNHQSVIDLATGLRSAGVDTPIVVGGQHPTAMPEQVLRDANGAIDWVVRGEGEQILAALADAPTNVDAIRLLPGICYLDDDNQFIKNKRPRFFDLSDITLPSSEILASIPMPKMPSYTLDTQGRRYTDIMFSVGCHNTCAYCYSPQMRGGLRKQSESTIHQLLESLHANGFRELVLQDDDLLSDRDGFLRLITMIKEHGFHWQDNGGIELELLDEPLIDAIADSNCTGPYVPVNPRKIADRFPRPEALMKVGLLSHLRERGIYTYTSGIYGVPNLENPSKSLDEIRALRDFHVDLVDKQFVEASLVFPLSALPGTKWYFEMKRHTEFVFDDSNWLSYAIYVPQLWPKSVSREKFEGELVEVHRQLNKVETSYPWFSPLPNNSQVSQRRTMSL
jgi:hypothetical protein